MTVALALPTFLPFFALTALNMFTALTAGVDKS